MSALTGGPTRSRPGWLIPVVVVGAILLLVVLSLSGSYNGMVDKEESVDQSFADLDSQLQRRNDLIPNLVAAVRGALEQEQAVFGEIARARQNYAGADSPEERLEAGNEVSSALGRLLVIVEAYPQLQSNANIRDLQVQLEGTENRIAQSRRDYNGVVTDYNRSIRRFPRSLLAGMFGFDRKPLFEAEPEAGEPPVVDLGVDTATTLG
ncbi:MAG: LemA family protein [Acidimicrobiales bacterium]|nr:LemA family protein [Acidimicrobiales bacterium]